MGWAFHVNDQRLGQTVFYILLGYVQVLEMYWVTRAG